jgi:hypothetical protein
MREDECQLNFFTLKLGAPVPELLLEKTEQKLFLAFSSVGGMKYS